MVRGCTWLVVGVLGSGFLSGCEDDGECTLVGCSGGTLKVTLVDDAGAVALARGELRTNRRPDPRRFDCTREPSNGSSNTCRAGVVQLYPETLTPSSLVEFRFERSDGSLSEWQPVEIAYEQHTDPDFNGPGCGCSWYTFTPEPVLVPVDARVTAR